MPDENSAGDKPACACECWEPAGEPHPPVNISKDAHDNFARVAAEMTPAGEQYLVPSVAPVSTAERVQHLASKPYSESRERSRKVVRLMSACSTKPLVTSSTCSVEVRHDGNNRTCSQVQHDAVCLAHRRRGVRV